ncbi:hypothetical protein IB268_24830 [Achromobacter sp. ACM01]|uniref:hypothetical protein n=1 Tax=Achromobacter sp. ACM01 TaxID=2769298 RepID=UPI001783BA31|nr:hypothetical protein [Achromobacter sp. ACM01]MBD9476162.1 hypothetical protein [Achromobacter sp. ACM01]
MILVIVLASQFSAEANARLSPEQLPSGYCNEFLSLTVHSECLVSRWYATAWDLSKTEHYARYGARLDVSSKEPVVINVTERPQPESSPFEKHWGSVLAIIVSLGTLLLSQIQFRRARERSVKDEFWIRQVAYPYVLQPGMEFIDWCTALPPPDNTQGPDNDTLRSTFREKKGAMMNRIGTLQAMSMPEAPGVLQAVVTRCRTRLQGAMPARTTDNASVINDHAPLSRKKGVDSEFEECVFAIEDAVITYLASRAENEASGEDYRSMLAALQVQRGAMVGALRTWQYNM